MLAINRNIVLNLNNKLNNFKYKNFKVWKEINFKYFLKKVSNEKNKKFFKDRKNIVLKFESLAGFILNINKLNLIANKNKKKMETKVYIYMNFSLKNKYTYVFLERVLILNFYFYFLFFLNHKHKYKYLEEILNNYFKKKILFNTKKIFFFLKIYFRWVDIKRIFVNTVGKNRKYRVKYRFLTNSRRLKHFNIVTRLTTDFKLFFFNLIFNIIKNYYKFILFIYTFFKNNKLSY